MRRVILFFLIAALPLFSFCPSVAAETVTWLSVEADSDTETLDLGDLNIGNYSAFGDFLARLPRLKRVDMYGSFPKSEQIDALQERFPDVEFNFSIKIGKQVVRTDATAFSTLFREGDHATDYNHVSMIRYCRHLYALDIGHNPVGRLDFLYDLPELRVLIVAICNLRDITPVASLEHLEYLEIFHNQIEDISCLTGLRYLMDLNLVRNRISDLTPLTEIKSLRRLWINRCNHSDPSVPDPKTVMMLRGLLPRCEVNELSSSTAGGWRKHPHYDTIHRMFNLGEYEPFEDSDPENMPEPWRTEHLQQTSGK